jgi:AP-1 complex subunit gamma-1
MASKLRDLIKAVRNAKTAADERSVIAKECAAIRAAFREEDLDTRHRNVAKLLYIHMLGYPTHFGQMECLKLIASPSYNDKRIGYLGLMLLLDERQEVLMLATHSLKSDLNHANQYVVGLALCAVANISSPEIARDASSDVQKLLGSSNPYLRKKAALAAVRIVRKVPEALENFVPRVKSLLTERNHGVLLTAVTLIISLCEVSAPEHDGVIDLFRKLVPSLVRILKNLVMSGYAPEHDVQGITDPFLQVKVLQLLRILGHGNAEASDAMNEILAQVATNTESLRNVGNAILYECVQTIMSIEAEAGLRVLAINILGRFLLNRDNNIRYVALNTLAKVVGRDSAAVQRHRATIVDCLKDSDVSIRRRALELIYVLVNADNVRPLVREMTNFLTVADHELRPDLTAKICAVAERFAPTAKWRVDTVLRVMALPGHHISERIQASLIGLIAATPELHAYAVGKLYLALANDPKQQALVQVAVWCVGEFGDLLVAAPVPVKKHDPVTVTEDDVISMFEKVLRSVITEPKTKELVLTALMKLTTRFQSSNIARIEALIGQFRTHINVELQQRSCEYVSIFGRSDSSSLRGALLERMPAAEGGAFADAEGSEQAAEVVTAQSIISSLSATATNSAHDPLDIMKQLFGDLPSDAGAARTEVTAVAPPPAAAAGPSLLDILTESPPPSLAGPSLIDVLNGPTPVSPSLPGLMGAASPYPQITALSKNGLSIVFGFSKPSGHTSDTVVLTSTTTNATPTPISDFELQAAVPKYITLTLGSPSGTVVPPHGSGAVTQQITLHNSLYGQKPLMLKIRVEYNIGGTKVVDTATVSAFPPGL